MGEWRGRKNEQKDRSTRMGASSGLSLGYMSTYMPRTLWGCWASGGGGGGGGGGGDSISPKKQFSGFLQGVAWPPGLSYPPRTILTLDQQDMLHRALWHPLIRDNADIRSFNRDRDRN